MAKLSFRIDGLRELQAKLRQIDDDVRKTALKKAVEEGAKPIVETARRLAPRSKKPRRPSVGHLADNIEAEPPRLAKTTATTRIGPSDGHFWGLFLELGTRKMRARPFMRPALDSQRVEAIEQMRDSLGDSLKEAAEK